MFFHLKISATGKICEPDLPEPPKVGNCHLFGDVSRPHWPAEILFSSCRAVIGSGVCRISEKVTVGETAEQAGLRKLS